LSSDAYGATLAAPPTFPCEATMAHTLTNDVWLEAGFLRRPRHDDDALDAIRGIILGSLVSLLVFWLPLAVALVR
jgi:hypothetical protein